MSDHATARSRGSDRRQLAGRLVLGTLAYFLLGLLGRATILEGEVLSLVWPAAGAAMLLYWLVPPRSWWLLSILVAVATVSLNLLTGATATQVGIFVVSNVAQGITAVLILRWLAGRLLPGEENRSFEKLRDFWPIMVASVVASLLGAAIGGVGRFVLLDSGSWLDVLVWFGRNAVGCVVVFTTGLLLLQTWHRVRQPSGGAELWAVVRRRAPEAIVLVAVTAGLYLSAFDWYVGRPVAFPLLLPTVWVGFRFPPLAVALHSVAVSASVVVYTVMDRGPFANLGSWPREVFVAQLFIFLIFCLGSLLALSMSERAALTRTLSEARATAEDQARLMSTIIDSMHDGVTVLNEKGQVLTRNPAGAGAIRTTTDSLTHVMDAKTALTTEGEPMRPEDFPWARAFAGENVVDQDMVLVFDDGSPDRTLAVSARRLPSLDPDGLRQAVLIYHDVTKDRAQRSALESFAGVVAHDLLGPLGVVEGWAELLANDFEARQSLSLDEAVPKLDRIRASVETMRHLIEDLLSSSTSRDQKLRATVVDLEAVARSVAEQRSEVTSGERPRVDIAVLPEVYADAAMVRQVLDNLVGNAIKYVVPGEKPYVRITGRAEGSLVEVTVADEGIGIPAEERDRVFEVFQRAHGVNGYDGHGIGLSVCKRIVERHGGRIAARPPVGERGARIVFTLPSPKQITDG
jgi:signal transduction histidine kinase/integral membrane sensor domain MASE1